MVTPPSEVEFSAAGIKSLLESQHPDLAQLPLCPAASGWDNAMYRLGDALAVRLPRRALAASLIENEQRWLPLLQSRLPLPIPAPVRIGLPQHGYPWHWSVVPWLNGETADLSLPDAKQGEALADFLNALHAAAPADAPRNPYRGVSLAQRAAKFTTAVQNLARRAQPITPRHHDIWESALAAPLDEPETWIHGDLHARNVLVVAGRLAAVIDWGDVARGDRATDLAGIWMLLPQRESRQRAMNGCREVSSATWRRARGWALLLAVIALDASIGVDSRMTAMAGRTLERLADGP